MATTLLTLNIPLSTLSVGAHVFGPASIPVGVTWASIVIDRTAGTSSLNSLPTTASVFIKIEVSLDGGTTWQEEVEAGTQGGIIIVRGVQLNTFSVLVQPIAGDPASTTRRARATVTTNTSVSVSGSLTLGN